MTDERFLAPVDMAHELRERGRARADRQPRHSSCAPRSSRWPPPPHASSTRLPRGDGHEVRGIRVFGGGSRSALYLDALQRRTPLPVSTGPVEATAHRERTRAGRSRWEPSPTRTRRVRHWPTTRRSRDERPGARTTRADAAPPRHRRPRPGLGARRRARRERDDDPPRPRHARRRRRGPARARRGRRRGTAGVRHPLSPARTRQGAYRREAARHGRHGRRDRHRRVIDACSGSRHDSGTSAI